MQPLPPHTPVVYRAPPDDDLAMLRRGELPASIRSAMLTMAQAGIAAAAAQGFRAGAARGVVLRREATLERRRHGFGKSTYTAWFVAGQAEPLHILRTPWPGHGGYFTTEDPSILLASDVPNASQVAAARAYLLQGQGLDEIGGQTLERGEVPAGLSAAGSLRRPFGVIVAGLMGSTVFGAMQFGGAQWQRMLPVVAGLALLAGALYLLSRSRRTVPSGQRVFEVRGPVEFTGAFGAIGGHTIRIGDCVGTFSYDKVVGLIVHGSNYRGFVLEGSRSLVALLP